MTARTFVLVCLVSLQLLRNKAYLVLLLCMGSVMAGFTCISTLLEQILCVQGYDDVRTQRSSGPSALIRISHLWLLASSTK